MKKTIFMAFNALLILNAANAGIIEPKTLWDKNKIVTCFYNEKPQLIGTAVKSYDHARKHYRFRPKELSRREKQKVTEVALRNFSEQRTGIHFVGFKDCSQTPSFDLIIMEAKGRIPILSRPSFNGRAVIGEDGELAKMPNGDTGFFDKSGLIPTIALTVQKAGTIVHEFGHVAGLRHEHIHEDAPQDKNCESPLVPIDFDKPESIEKPHSTTLFHTNYDPQSIMNYCWLKTEQSYLNSSTSVILSQKDIETLKNFYQ
jgi:hypothetical protein